LTASLLFYYYGLVCLAFYLLPLLLLFLHLMITVCVRVCVDASIVFSSVKDTARLMVTGEFRAPFLEIDG
jgi:hypothetical protein